MSWDLIKDLLLPPVGGSTTITIVYWSLLALFAGLEFVVPQLGDSHRGERWPANFSLGFLNLTLIPLIPISVLWAASWAQHNKIGLLNMWGDGWWLPALVATIGVQSFVDYASHVLFHKAPLLWRAHRVHHFDTAVDVSTGLRHHPLEFLVMLSISIPVAIVFGLLPLALIIYGTADAMFALFTHANFKLPTRLDRALRFTLVTPRIHAVHHSAHRPETDSNYGNVFTVWDRLCGTYCDLRADCPEQMQFGLTELQDERASHFWWQLKSPIYPIADPKPEPAARSEPSLS
jgi:sterol desaturase/sphingolipid hydroxylase (fatty acid hydroxylase superfamily)